MNNFGSTVSNRYWENEEVTRLPNNPPQCKHEWINISLLTQKLVCKLCDYEMDEHGNAIAPKSKQERKPELWADEEVITKEDVDFYSIVLPSIDPYLTDLANSEARKKAFLDKIRKAKGIFNGPPVAEEEEIIYTGRGLHPSLSKNIGEEDGN